MKAAQVSQYGGAEVIKVIEIDIPSLKEGQVLVEVHAAALNPFDYKVRSGAFQKSMPLSLPYTIGGDFSGVIKSSRGASEFEAGQEVYGAAQVSGGNSGALAEFATVKTTRLAIKPGSVDHTHAAGSVLVGVSALQALDDHLNLQSGQKILIHGGAGGIGHMAIQYAKHSGAYVATTAKASDVDFVKGLGADEVIDYENQKFEDVLSGYDAVYDTIGGETYARSFDVLKKGGKIVSMVEQPNEQLAQTHDVKAMYQSSTTDTQTLEKLAGLMDSKVMQVNIDKIFSLEQAAQAFDYLETAHPRGKVVVRVKI